MLAILSALVGTFMHVAAPLRAVDSAPLVTRNDCVEHEQSQRGLRRNRRLVLERLKSAPSQWPRRPRWRGSRHTAHQNLFVPKFWKVHCSARSMRRNENAVTKSNSRGGYIHAAAEVEKGGHALRSSANIRLGAHDLLPRAVLRHGGCLQLVEVGDARGIHERDVGVRPARGSRSVWASLGRAR